jgi:hypothetical protein
MLVDQAPPFQPLLQQVAGVAGHAAEAETVVLVAAVAAAVDLKAVAQATLQPFPPRKETMAGQAPPQGIQAVVAAVPVVVAVVVLVIVAVAAVQAQVRP